MSRKIHQKDKNMWKLPTIYSFVSGYGPFKPPKGFQALGGAVVVLYHSGSDGDDGNEKRHAMHGLAVGGAVVVLYHSGSDGDDGNEKRHAMHGLAGQLQPLLLDDTTDAAANRQVFVMDLKSMFDHADNNNNNNNDHTKDTPPLNSTHIPKSNKPKTPTAATMTYPEALSKEEETVELTKGFGKVVLKVLQRMLFTNITLIASATKLCALAWKLHAALQVADPDMIADMWFCFAGAKLSTKFVKTHLVARSTGTSMVRQHQQTPLHIVTTTQQQSRVEMLRCFFPNGDLILVDGDHSSCCSRSHVWLVRVLGVPTTDPTAPYDPDVISDLGKSLFLSTVSVEMNRYTKQYERNAVDITADLAVVVKTPEDNNNNSNQAPLTDIDRNACPREVGALVLRGNRCVLVRSLDKHWDGMRIPSVTAKQDESLVDAAKRAVVEFTGVEATEVQELSSLIQPVHIFGPNGRPVIVQLVPLYAVEPPPDGPLEDADMEDDETPYDWYLYHNAKRKLSHDHASLTALQIMALSLIQAANVGLVPTKWGGVLGQEINLGLSTTVPKSVGGGTADTSPNSSLNCGSNNAPVNNNNMLQVEIEEWHAGGSGASHPHNPDAHLMKEVEKANEALKKRLVSNKGEGPRKLPVTLLSGFLGSGKTTMMSHILTNAQGLKVAVLVNDMGEINIDAAILRQNSVNIQQKQEHMVELSNGCICCTLREDLLTEVAKIAASPEEFDYLMIESSGISEPLPVAETFTFEDENGLKLGDVAELDTLVTVVDGGRFFSELNSLESLRTRNWHADPEDQRTISHLLCDQVEFSNVIVLNKCDLMSVEEKETVKTLLKSMNPTAVLVESEFGHVPLSHVLGTRLFSMKDAEQHEGWLQEARIGEHTPETEEYGISSFTYRARRPLVPHKFHQVLQKMLNNQTEEPFQTSKILRAKGFVWLTTCHQLQGDFSLAGTQVSLLPGNPWWAEIDKADWPENLERDIAPLWREPYGDRQQEIVWIGQSLDKEAICAALDECLVSAKDMKGGPERWTMQTTIDEVDPFQEDWQAAIDELVVGHDHTHDHHDHHSHSHEHSPHCNH